MTFILFKLSVQLFHWILVQHCAVNINDYTNRRYAKGGKGGSPSKSIAKRAQFKNELDIVI